MSKLLVILFILALSLSFAPQAMAYSINLDAVENAINKYYPQLKENTEISKNTLQRIIQSRYYDSQVYSIPYNYCKLEANNQTQVYVGVYPTADQGNVMLTFGKLSSSKYIYWGVDAVRNSLGTPGNPPHPIFVVPKSNLKGVRLIILRDPKENNNPNDDNAEVKLEIQDAIFDQPVKPLNQLPTCDKI